MTPAATPPERQSPQAPRTPRRTLFLLNSLCVGGAEKQVVSLLNRLNPLTHETTLVLLKDEMTLRSQIEPGRCRGGVVGLGVQRGLDWRAVRALAQHIDAHSTDIVVCTNLYAYAYAWLARQGLRRSARRGGAVKLVEVFHTTLPGSRKESLLMQLYRPLVRDADLLVYVCQPQAEHWRARRLKARHEAVIHNGIDAEHFAGFAGAATTHPGFGPDDLVVGVCAAMRPEKAHVDLVEAVARCRDARAGGLSMRPVRALLIGDGPERPAIEQRIQTLGLGDHVRLLGAMRDVRPAVAACDLMVMPSRAVETFSIAALEAMAMARPVLMTDIGGARELVRPGETGWLVAPGDVQGLSSTLQRLADPAMRPTLRSMGRQAQRMVCDRFTVERMTQGYEQAFERLLQPGPPGSPARGEREAVSQPASAGSAAVGR